MKFCGREVIALGWPPRFEPEPRTFLSGSSLLYHFIYKICKNIYNIYTIIYKYAKYQAVAARPGPEAPGPALGPRPGPGPISCIYLYIFCVYLVYFCVYLCIPVYILVYLVYNNILGKSIDAKPNREPPYRFEPSERYGRCALSIGR